MRSSGCGSWSMPTVTRTSDAARLAGETSRRLIEGWLDPWDDAADPALESQGAPRARLANADFDPTDPEHNPSLKAAPMLHA